MAQAKRPDTNEVIASIGAVADNLTEQVAALRRFVTVLQEEYEHPEKRLVALEELDQNDG